MSHTPGPWRFGVMEFTDDCQEVFTEKPFDFMPGCLGGNPSIYAGTEQIVGCDEYYIFSNADDIRLIAAAPDLLKALQAIAAYPTLRSAELSAQSMRELARAEIAKATGGE